MGVPDFSGWATKANIKCTDGRTIMPDAFKHMDGKQVPLVYMHGHTGIENVLGYAVLHHKDEGVRADGYFNATPSGQNAKLMVEHGDIKYLSIYANDLVEHGKNVMHGNIRETSLVLAGANRGAVIDTVNIRHSDGFEQELEGEAIIFTGLELFHDDINDPAQTADAPSTTDTSAEPDAKTVQQVWDSLTQEQQDVVNYIVDAAVEMAQDPDGDGDNDAAQGVADDQKDGEAAHTDTNKSGEGDLSHQEGAKPPMTRNVFETQSATRPQGTATLQHGGINPRTGGELKHADLLFTAEDKRAMFEAAMKGGSLKQAFEDACLKHGVSPMDVLFPEYRALDNVPQFNSRRMEWVQPFLNGLSHSPFSRVKSIVADITMDEARAKGYVKGNIKREEWFSVSKRFTTPTTIYKKQQVDRDDVIDITDFDMIAWLKGEMDLMLKEEIARAILIGDGRDIADVDKIADPGNANSGAGLRSIVNEHELYKTDVNVNMTATPNWELVVEGVLSAMEFYKGTGTPTFYTTWQNLTKMLLIKDGMQRRLYPTKADLAAAMNVADIVPVEVLESPTAPANLIGIIVNPGDYNVGADKGGEVNLFDFFDIDYNQYKYLIETRISGAMTRVKGALAVWSVPSADVAVTPGTPTFDSSTGIVTVPNTANIVWKDGNGNTLAAGAQAAIAKDSSITIVATPAAGYYIPTSGNRTAYWTFTRPNPSGANSNA
jgi:hypothetical protein